MEKCDEVDCFYHRPDNENGCVSKTVPNLCVKKNPLMIETDGGDSVLCNVGLSALNEMWQEQCSMCCKLPCTDTICREDMDSEGGCHGAKFADIFMQIIRGR